MSYYKLRSFHINKDGNPQVSVADSSLYPLEYFSTEYVKEGQTPEENLYDFCISLLEGNIQPNRLKALYNAPNKPGSLIKTMNDLMMKYVPAVSLEKDMEVKVNMLDGLESLLAKKYGVPMLQSKDIDLDAVIKELQEYNEKAKQAYWEKEQQLKDEGIVTVRAALSSDIFPCFTILFNANADETIIAKSENYGNNGFLDNSDRTAVFMGNLSGRLFHPLSEIGILSFDRELQIRDMISEACKEPVIMGLSPEHFDDIAQDKTISGLFITKVDDKWHTLKVDKKEQTAEEDVFNDKVDALMYLKGDTSAKEPFYEIYQLKDNDEAREFHYRGYQELLDKNKHVWGYNYEKLYTGKYVGEGLEDVFERFNMDRPDDFYGHSLSVSDVVRIHTQDSDRAYYVDSIGFKELESFNPDTVSYKMNRLYWDLKNAFENEPDRLLTICTKANGQFNTTIRDAIKACKRADRAAKNERDPEIRFSTGADPMNRGYTKNIRFSDLMFVTVENMYFFEDPGHRNKRYMEEAIRQRQDNSIERR